LLRLFRPPFSALILLVCVAACASRSEPRLERDTAYLHVGSLRDEIVGRARFNSLRITGEITLARDDRPLVEDASAVLYVSPPDSVRLRIYRMGIPVLDLLFRDNQVWSRPETEASAFGALVNGLFPALLWWQKMGSAELYPLRDSLMLATPGHKVWVDRESLLPLIQEFVSPSGPVYVQYSSPETLADGRRFPAHIAVVASSYSGLITIRKMAVDESLRPELFLWASD